jgi:hypothetical protein
LLGDGGGGCFSGLEAAEEGGWATSEAVMVELSSLGLCELVVGDELVDGLPELAASVLPLLVGVEASSEGVGNSVVTDGAAPSVEKKTTGAVG